MNKLLIIFFISMHLLGCQRKVSSNDLPKINGYWEIEKVIFADGTTKDYTINETFEYISIKNKIGFRKKVTPQFDGTFLVNETSEKVTVNEVKGVYFLNYSTPFAKWKEELLKVSDLELITKNTANDEYHYKKAASINLTGNGKKVQ